MLAWLLSLNRVESGAWRAEITTKLTSESVGGLQAKSVQLVQRSYRGALSYTHAHGASVPIDIVPAR